MRRNYIILIISLFAIYIILSTSVISSLTEDSKKRKTCRQLLRIMNKFNVRSNQLFAKIYSESISPNSNANLADTVDSNCVEQNTVKNANCHRVSTHVTIVG